MDGWEKGCAYVVYIILAVCAARNQVWVGEMLRGKRRKEAHSRTSRLVPGQLFYFELTRVPSCG